MKTGLKSLRASLLALLAAIFLPLIAVAVALVIFQWQQQRERGLAQLQEQARTLRSTLDRELTLDVAVLNALAESSELDRGDWQAFYAVARRTAAVRQGSWIILVDSRGQNLINTAVPFGSPLPNLRDSLKSPTSVDWQGRLLPLPELRIFEEPLVTAKPAFSGLVYGRLSKRPVVATNVPVMRAGKGVFVLGIAYSPDYYSSLARDQLPTADHIASIVDSKGLVLARSRAAANFLGVRAPLPFGAGSGNLPAEGWGQTANLEGQASYYAFSRSSVAGWVAVVGVPKAVLLSPAWRALGYSLAMLSLLIASASFLAHRLWRRIAIPLTRLAEHASAEPLVVAAIQGSGIREVDALKAALISASQAQQLRRLSEEEREQALRALEAANASLQQADRRKNEFLAMLGHELRNPLAAIGSAAAVLSRHGGSELLRPMHDILARQIRHLARLVDDLLDVARITHSKLSVNLQPLRLDVLVERIAQEMRARMDARHQQFQVDIDQEVVISGDEVRLSQVVSNLLDNAVKYTPEFGCIELSLKREASVALVRVSDNGMGMGPDLLQSLFQPFMQGTQALERPQGGLGLGLAIAREVVQLHGGSIEARSQGESCGFEVLVWLPVMPATEGRPCGPCS